MTTTAYILGLDLGQRVDWTALSVLRKYRDATGKNAYDVVRLDRWQGKSYHEIPAIVQPLYPAIRQMIFEENRNDPNWISGPMPDRKVPISLVVDGTGVGVAVVDSLREAGLDCTSVTIHGGDAVTRKGNEVRVPKRELVAKTQVLLQTRRLSVNEALPGAGLLVKELENFRSKTNLTTGHDTYGAGEDWREGNHDDMVLSVAMAAYYGETNDPSGFDPLRRYMKRQLRPYR